jgi:hypothetical protein
LDHGQRLISEGLYASLLSNVLTPQSVEVLIGIALTTETRICKVDLNSQGVFDESVLL